MKEYLYQIFTPGGNTTALVFDLVDNLQVRKSINDNIMKKFPYVEQVGFLSTDVSKPQLVMAGGEFCGNATRCAAWHYLNGTHGELSLKVSGVCNQLKAGVTKKGEVWAEIPTIGTLNDVIEFKQGFFLVKLEGILHVVVMPEQSKMYLKKTYNIKQSAMSILCQNKLLDSPAAGVIFVEQTVNALKIHPCVYVSRINTLFYETACGSGTVAVGLVFALLNRKSEEITVIQPSTKTIRVFVSIKGEEIDKAIISGGIEVHEDIYKGMI